MSFLFAYGSLRPAADHAEIRDLVARLKPIGSGRLPGRLYHLGRYPGAIFDASALGTVVGQVFEFQDDTLLADVDAYEGYDPARPDTGQYVRRKHAVEVVGVGAVECWLYELRERTASAILIEGGDYVAWLKQRRPP